MNHKITRASLLFFFNTLLLISTGCDLAQDQKMELKATAAVVNMVYDDTTIPIGGWITPRFVKGFDAPLRVQSVVISNDKTKICLVTCDVIYLHRDFLDDVSDEIETLYGIPFENIMFSASHSHAAPYQKDWSDTTADQTFNQILRNAIIEAVGQANKKLQSSGEMDYYFGQSYAKVGQNSRVILEDGSALWVPCECRFGYNRPTGPFDAELPVLAFKDKQGKQEIILFNHSTHNIGSNGNGHSPCFYGLASQEIERELGVIVAFLPGAFGSTHVFNCISVEERISRIKDGINRALAKAEKRKIDRLVSVKKEFEFTIRTFDEEQQQKAVSDYCNRWFGDGAAQVIQTFKDRRDALEPQQGEKQKTWLQVMLIGDIAFVGVPCELFAELGMEIKRRSPFRYTYVVGIANDYIGYMPDKEAFDLGGYQTWATSAPWERDTGERIVEESIKILNAL
jgi:hypothetical protein